MPRPSSALRRPAPGRHDTAMGFMRPACRLAQPTPSPTKRTERSHWQIHAAVARFGEGE
ncbi:hypothetical protein TCAP_06046 [Tolypocladium capitatum]|uniref:Uncharacterized protein n=1 Tax=Tolypocladium capitatum TaxID=45235 RepID=A0A2K3Q8X9_9HYPO|nr:hypothetical protein TCAP_06046 [Tolypocladium capitatum]